MPPTDPAEIITPEKIRQTGESIAELQLSSGMIPWFPNGHADPWNHIEAAMALDVAELHDEALSAYQWLADIQLENGSWHNYYLENEIEQDKIDTNCVAYIATGVLHHYLLSKDTGFLETMWKVVEPAIEFVLDLQTPRGAIIWACHSDGTPWSYALTTGSSSISHSLRAAIAIAEHLGEDRPQWRAKGNRLVQVLRNTPEAFAP
ncbi:MAG: prenyltransferase, partial [Actinomycetota bacterium]|nr:prenyltransferase [Actinomycetota bacterium]